jgi:N-acetylglucosamine kinase-like BadF-type ATPase
VFLGVDGGGTKTALCVIDRTGARLASSRAPSIYYFGADIALVEEVLTAAVTDTCSSAGVSPADIEHAFIGYPGYGEASEHLSVLDALPRRVLGHERYTCDNDMVCAWAGSLGADDGINVVSGTGSLAYGECAGRGARAGGWSPLFGDEGSGYWIGAAGLAAFSKMSDGRIDEGPLLSALRRHLGIRHDLDAIDVVLNRWRGSRSDVAALSTIVSGAAADGDLEARRILDRAGVELAALAGAVSRRLPFPDGGTVPVSYSGGAFNIDAVLASFRRRVSQLDGSFEVRPPLMDPAGGAALYAAKRAGLPLEASAVRRLGAASRAPATLA